MLIRVVLPFVITFVNYSACSQLFKYTNGNRVAGERQTLKIARFHKVQLLNIGCLATKNQSFTIFTSSKIIATQHCGLNLTKTKQNRHVTYII
jgi:hypothetical protein